MSEVLNLQLFAEGTGGAGGAEGATGVEGSVPGFQSNKGEKNPLANVQYGKQEVQAANAQEQSVDDRQAAFEKMIKGEYKDLYDKRVSDTVQKRLKGSKETVDRYNALAPTLELLGSKYGVDASDIEALNKAIQEDDSYYEDEALERGLTVEQLKQIKKMERENADLKAQMQAQANQERADALYQRWMGEAEQLKQYYPTFDIETELRNPTFADLISNNIDMRTAFEVVHKDEIIPAAMQYTASQVSQKMTNALMNNSRRPAENGMRSQSSSLVKNDVRQLSKADREEIARRVARGERISF